MSFSNCNHRLHHNICNGVVCLTHKGPDLHLLNVPFWRESLGYLAEEYTPENVFVLLFHLLYMTFDEPSKARWNKPLLFAHFFGSTCRLHDSTFLTCSICFCVRTLSICDLDYNDKKQHYTLKLLKLTHALFWNSKEFVTGPRQLVYLASIELTGINLYYIRVFWRVFDRDKYMK